MPEIPADRPHTPHSTARWIAPMYMALMVCLGWAWAQGSAKTFGFRSFYAAGRILLSRPHHLYDMGLQAATQNAHVSVGHTIPFYHPAAETLVYAVFAVLPFRAAYLGFLAFNLALVLLVIRLLPDPVANSLRRWPKALLVCAYFPVFMTIFDGQDSLMFAVLCCLALRCATSGRGLQAGLLLGLATFRPQLAVPLALIFALREGWRFLAGFGAGAGAMGALSFALCGYKGFGNFVDLITRASDLNTSAQKAMAVVPRLMPNLFGLLWMSFSHVLSLTGLRTLGIVASGLVFVAGCLLSKSARSRELAFSVGAVCAVLVSHHLYVYDLTLLLIPLFLLDGRLHGTLAAFTWAAPVVLLCGSQLRWHLLAFASLALLAEAFALVRRRKAIEALQGNSPEPPQSLPLPLDSALPVVLVP